LRCLQFGGQGHRSQQQLVGRRQAQEHGCGIVSDQPAAAQCQIRKRHAAAAQGGRRKNSHRSHVRLAARQQSAVTDTANA